jgi:glycosyltransferase involved in cell wall biosynthesis
MSDKKPKTLAIIWANYGPYHCARACAAVRLASEQGAGVLCVQIAGREDLYPWERPGQRDQLQIRTLFADRTYETLGNAEARREIIWLLEQERPECVAVAGYTVGWQQGALAWARRSRRAAILMSASKWDDARRVWWKEWLKGRIVRRFGAALVGGAPQVDYLVRLGMPRERVFVGYDVVDNDYFQREADAVRKTAAEVRARYGLPESYFLFVGRFDPVKNLSRLMDVYAAYKRLAEKPWDLVLCGSGEEEPAIRQRVELLGLESVRFMGFRQISELPSFYGLASAFVAASTKDTWNLTVNEAMAGGLPVLVSRACGCAQDLVKDGVNGFTFDPYDVEGLARLMARMSSGERDLAAMGRASRETISQWSPQLFAENLLKAATVAIDRAKRGSSLWPLCPLI